MFSYKFLANRGWTRRNFQIIKGFSERVNCVCAVKDKTEVLAELAELTKVRDELTTDVERLTMELEREKSQNHKMKAELDKLKVNLSDNRAGLLLCGQLMNY